MKRVTKSHRKTRVRNIARLFIIALSCLTLVAGIVWAEIPAGDVDENRTANLGDAIAALQILVKSGLLTIRNGADVGGDRKIGLEEAVHALRAAAGLPSGVAGSSGSDRVGPRPRHAHLQSVDGCTTLLDDFKQSAIEEMEREITQNLNNAIEWGGCGWYWPMYAMDDVDMIGTGGNVSLEKGASEYSETNTQVEGVDEADFVKNDGSHIYILADGRFHIIAAWPPEEAHTLSSFRIEGDPKRMFVHDNRAFIYSSLKYVASDRYDGYGPYHYDMGRDNECTYGYNCEFTGDGRELKITVLDISKLDDPALVREIYFSGSYLNSRRIREAVHSVLVFPEPWIGGLTYWPKELEDCWNGGGYWEDDVWHEPDKYTEEELRTMFESLRQKNEEMILSSDITDWLPSVRDIRYADGQAQEEEGLLGTCEDFYVSVQEDGKNFLSMVSTGMEGTGDLNATTILGRPGAVYASSSAFYIASKHERYGGMFWFFDEEERIEEASSVHKFTLKKDPPSSAYKGSGVVKGSVLNQFSMDEHDGFFRMATTTGYAWDKNVHSTISIFEDDGDELVLVGQVDDIALGEDIRSARFDGDKGFVVTFKKTDPLFAFDLSDPMNPTIEGELKIPGFSTYMHLMDDTHLLTIGYDTEESETGNFAWFQGIMLQIFDVSDMSTPALIHKEIIGTRGSTSDAATNHLAFNFFRPKEVLAIPMAICEGGTGGSYGNLMSFSGLMVYKVTNEAGFEYLGGVSHEEPETEDTFRGACSSWWTNPNSKVKRSIFMDDYVFSITENEIKADLVSNLGTDVAVIDLTE